MTSEKLQKRDWNCLSHSLAFNLGHFQIMHRVWIIYIGENIIYHGIDVLGHFEIIVSRRVMDMFGSLNIFGAIIAGRRFPMFNFTVLIILTL